MLSEAVGRKSLSNLSRSFSISACNLGLLMVTDTVDWETPSLSAMAC